MRKGKKSKKELYWVLQVVGWGAFSLTQLITKYLFTQKIDTPDITITFFVAVLGIFFSHIVRWIYKHFNWHKQDLRFILHKVAITAFFTALLHLLVLHSFVFACPKNVHHTFDLLSTGTLIARFSIAYFIWGVMYFMVYFFTNFKKAEIINLENKAQLSEIHLNKLKSQLNPHFMFNAMNVIRALIDEDKNKAKEGITKLSNILRQTLNVNQQKLISIKDELHIVNDYLSLEEMRFEERLTWKIKVSESHQDVKIPPMLLQTIVENAIKHGISNEIEGGTIEIQSSEQDQSIQICVLNPGKYNPGDKQVGYGLKNSKERLQVIFDGAADISIENSDNNTVKTCIILPKSSNND